MTTWSERRDTRHAADQAGYEKSLRAAGGANSERSTPRPTRLPPRLVVLLSVLTMNVVLASPAAAAAGALDTSFDSDGKVTTDFGGIDQSFGLAIQPDGKIVAAGFSWSDGFTGIDFAIDRYNPDGSLDTNFDSDGKVTTDFGASFETAWSVAIQPDGKIVAAGSMGDAFDEDFALVRYNPDGSLDTSFGGGGMVTTSFGGFEFERAFGVAIQPDGRIVAAGFSGSDFALARYKRDGSLDNSFDSDGKVTTVFGHASVAFGVAIQPDGRIVAAGGQSLPFNANFALARYKRDGSLDNSFDSDGKVITDFGSEDSARSVAIQPDGKIVAAGHAEEHFALARYSRDGTLDTSFDSDGKATTDFGTVGSAYGVAIQPDGRIVVAGSISGNFAVARYNRDGSLDTSFDSDGKAIVDFGSYEEAWSVALQRNGRIVVAGFTSLGEDNNDFALARLLGT
jgi:uncharacterized delta-60 repeat protein